MTEIKSLSTNKETLVLGVIYFLNCSNLNGPTNFDNPHIVFLVHLKNL